MQLQLPQVLPQGLETTSDWKYPCDMLLFAYLFCLKQTEGPSEMGIHRFSTFSPEEVRQDLRKEVKFELEEFRHLLICRGWVFLDPLCSTRELPV